MEPKENLHKGLNHGAGTATNNGRALVGSVAQVGLEAGEKARWTTIHRLTYSPWQREEDNPTILLKSERELMIKCHLLVSYAFRMSNLNPTNVTTSSFQLQRINKLRCQSNILLSGAKALNLIKNFVLRYKFR
ncbi:hypothetical protein Leryth_025677 [Lithospermum erythrorhizon]|nr:hypothetical protein Leryth_025677 [Lithospermum erythrorhizon]